MINSSGYMLCEKYYSCALSCTHKHVIGSHLFTIFLSLKLNSLFEFGLEKQPSFSTYRNFSNNNVKRRGNFSNIDAFNTLQSKQSILKDRTFGYNRHKKYQL